MERFWATHTERARLFDRAADLIVNLARRHYFENDNSILPQSIVTETAFKNAMALDIAMGGSTNTVLHILAAAHSANVDFSLNDIDALSRQVPCLCKVAPSSAYHLEDVHRAGGIMAILGELAKSGLIDTKAGRIDSPTLEQTINDWDIAAKPPERAMQFYKAAPGGGRNLVMGSQSNLYRELDLDRVSGCIRNVDHAYSADGGLAVLFGNLSPNGAIVKTAGVDESILTFSGPGQTI